MRTGRTLRLGAALVGLWAFCVAHAQAAPEDSPTKLREEDVPPEPPPVASAQAPPPAPPARSWRLIDLGASVGYNNPGGMLGGELDWRYGPRLSVGGAAGVGLWGLRISPHGRFYPVWIGEWAVFFQAGFSFNAGGRIRAVENGVTWEVIQQFTPVLDLALGLRRDLLGFAYVSLLVGYGAQLINDNYLVVGGGTLPPLTRGAIEFAEPGGLILAFSAGISFL